MSATPLGFWKLPARPDGAARHLAVITGGEAQQTMLFLQDGQWSILALFQDELAGKAAARTLDALLQSVTCLRMGGRDVLDGATLGAPKLTKWQKNFGRRLHEAGAARDAAEAFARVARVFSVVGVLCGVGAVLLVAHHTP